MRYEPAAPCNPFGGLTRLKAVERKIADIHFLVDKEVEELALLNRYYAAEAEKFQRQLDYQAASIASIDMEPTPSTTYSKHEVDESLGDIWKELKKAKLASAANSPKPAASIASIDMEPTPSTTYSKHEVDESLGDIWKELKKAKLASAANSPKPVNLSSTT
ncbi:hypothetical protein Bca52824_035253 [Brassica carinata]|uniref:Uncharacterized protein n=1 Tax=Brassica carinata TaxID=52824 RepID=A0A8X7S3B3_BRACI|nr:hypothetical protein Bca52824_035253 [Brassica carinata]